METLNNQTGLSECEIQAINFATKYGVKMSVKYVGYGAHFVGEKESRHIYKVVLTRNKKRMTVNFGQSINAGKIEPTLYDVLACLTKYDCDSFENFCDTFGYVSTRHYYLSGRINKDSMKIYNSCCKEFESVERVFGDCENCMNDLKEIN